MSATGVLILRGSGGMGHLLTSAPSSTVTIDGNLSTTVPVFEMFGVMVSVNFAGSCLPTAGTAAAADSVARAAVRRENFVNCIVIVIRG